MKSKLENLPIELQQGELVTRYDEWGDLAVRYVHVPAGTDMTPVLEGLPGDRCPSPHWGMVLEGSIHLVHADGSEEITREGEVYYWPEGHTAYFDEACTFFELGPAPEMRKFGDHAKAKLG